MVEHDGLDAELGGEWHQPEPFHLSTTRPRVAQQDRPTRWPARLHPDVQLVEFVDHRGTSRPQGDHQERSDKGRAGNDAIGAVERVGDREEHRAQPDGYPHDPDRPTRHRLGDEPPAPGYGHAETDETDREAGTVAHEDVHDRDGE